MHQLPGKVAGSRGPSLPHQARGPVAEDDHSIVAHLLRLRDPAGKPLSKDRLIQEFFIFFLAGAETTG